MTLVTCPVCGRERVSDTACCPGCKIPVDKYLAAKPSFVSPVKGDKVTCSECGHTAALDTSMYCSGCGARLPKRVPVWMAGNPKCPMCKSPRTDCFYSEMKERSAIGVFLSGKTSIHWLKSYWCHNCGHVFKETVG